MADVFSQKQIDSLLQGSAEPQRQAAEVIPYNFLRPPRISKDRQVLINGIYGRVAGSIQSLLSSRLRTPVDVVVSSVEQATFSEFIFSLANPCAAFVYDLGEKVGGQGVLDLGTELSYHLLDRLFGGPGDASDMKRPLTALERIVVRGVGDKIVALVQEAWQEHLPFHCECSGFEASPDALQIANREDNVLVANIEVKTGNFGGLMTVCLPLLSLEAFLQEKPARLVTNGRISTADRSVSRGVIEQALRGARVTMAARFPPFFLRAADLASLKVGQVIHTGHPSDVPVEVYVRGHRQFLGVLGQRRQYVGLRVLQVFDDPIQDTHSLSSRGRVV
jgi:flagellar motor switch protein FliM